jgi:hypothetical protein
VTLGQVNALETTLSSIDPQVRSAVALVQGGHVLGSAPFTVTAATWSVSNSGTGAGTILFRVTDGLVNCDVPIVCNASAVARANATGSCTFAGNSVLTYTYAAGTGTCTQGPLLQSLDVVGHR